MRAQLSIEMLVYLSLSVAGLLAAAYMYARGNAAISRESGQDAIAQFVAVLNAHTGYQSSSFGAFVPSQICRSSITPDGVSYMNGTYLFGAYMDLDGAYLCSISGSDAVINMTMMQNGTFLVG